MDGIMDAIGKLIYGLLVGFLLMIGVIFFGSAALMSRGADAVVDAVSPGSPRADARKAEEERIKTRQRQEYERQQAQDRYFERMRAESKTTEQKEEEASREAALNFGSFVRDFEQERSRLLSISYSSPQYSVSLTAPYKATVKYGFAGEIVFESIDGSTWTLRSGSGTVWNRPDARSAAQEAAQKVNSR